MDFEIVVFPVTHEGDSLDAVTEIEATTMETGMLLADAEDGRVDAGSAYRAASNHPPLRDPSGLRHPGWQREVVAKQEGFEDTVSVKWDRTGAVEKDIKSEKIHKI